MFNPPSIPTRRSTPDVPSVETLLICSILPPLTVLLLWTLQHPLVGSLLLIGTVGIAVSARRVLGLRRCFHECGGFSVDVIGDIRITITPARPENPS